MKSPEIRRWWRYCVTVSQRPLQLLGLWLNKSCSSLVRSHCSIETSHSSSEMSPSNSVTATRDTSRCCRGAETVTFVLLHELCDCCTAVRQTENFRHKRRALYANPQHQIIQDTGYVHFRNCTYFVTLQNFTQLWNHPRGHTGLLGIVTKPCC